jgi:hypothetical protein
MKLNNGKVFVFIFLLTALIFSFGLLWFAQVKQQTHLNELSESQLNSLFTAHASKGYVLKDLKLVQLQQVEILEEADFSQFITKYSFLKDMQRLHINVIYNYILPLDQNYKLNYQSNENSILLTFSDFNVRLNEPIMTLKDTRLENKPNVNLESLKINDSEVSELLVDLKPMMIERGNVQIKTEKLINALNEELTQHLRTWLRVQNVKDSVNIKIVN